MQMKRLAANSELRQNPDGAAGKRCTQIPFLGIIIHDALPSLLPLETDLKEHLGSVYVCELR